MKQKSILYTIAIAVAILLLSEWMAGNMTTPPIANATTVFQVNSTLDAVDANPGDGVCSTASGQCTLRAAIMESNSTDELDTINLPAGNYVLTLSGANENYAWTGDLDITEPLEILGDGFESTIIDGNQLDRVFHIYRSPAFISGVTIQNGFTTDIGGGVYISQDYSADPSDDPMVTLENTAIISNISETGGGIYNWGVLTIKNSRILNNQATGRNNGGGGIYSDWRIVSIDLPSLVIENSHFENNSSASQGSGVSAFCGTVHVVGSTFQFNISANDTCGGAIVQPCSQGKTRIVGSTFNQNEAGGCTGVSGGGERLEVINSTFSGNIATSGDASAIYGDHAVLKNVTIADNVSQTEGAIRGSFDIVNTILAYNAPKNCGQYATLTNRGYNLSSDYSCAIGSRTDKQGTDPLLSLLGSFGGPTQTYAIPSDSPAVDSGDPTNCPATDQRGVQRPKDGNNDGEAVCDRGSYELQEQVIYLPFVGNP